MKNRNIIPLFFALASIGTLSAEEANPVIEPAAKAILEESVKAVGGKEAILKIKSRQIEGKMVMAAQGIEMKMSLTQKGGTKALMKMESPGIIVDQGYDGETAWSKNSLQGIRELVGPELEQAKEAATISVELSTLNNLTSAKLLDDAEENGKTFKVIEITSKDAIPKTLYFDTDTKLLAQTVSKIATGPDTTVETTVSFSDYKELDGVKYPFTTKMKIIGQDVTLSVSSIQQNIEVDDAIFALPE